MAPKSIYFENVYFVNNICQEMDQVILSFEFYEFYGRQVFSLPEINL